MPDRHGRPERGVVLPDARGEDQHVEPHAETIGVELLVQAWLVGAVQSLTRPSGTAALHGPAPVDDDNNPIAPADSCGLDHLWFLDRMEPVLPPPPPLHA